MTQHNDQHDTDLTAPTPEAPTDEPTTDAPADAEAPATDPVVNHLIVGAASQAQKTEKTEAAPYGLTLGQGIAIAIERDKEHPVVTISDYVAADPKNMGRSNPDHGALRAVLLALNSFPRSARDTLDLTVIVDRRAAEAELLGYTKQYGAISSVILRVAKDYANVRFIYGTQYRSPVVHAATLAALQTFDATAPFTGTSTLSAEDYAAMRAAMSDANTESSTAPTTSDAMTSLLASLDA